MSGEDMLREITLRLADVLGTRRDIYIQGALAGGVR
jgi:hypothetical protein